MPAHRISAAALAVGTLAVLSACASRPIAAPQGSSAPAVSSAAGASSSALVSRPCVHPDPPDPPPVSPAIPGVAANGDLASVWSLDAGQLTVAPAAGARPAVERAQAMCTLLAALAINGGRVLEEGSGLTLFLGKVSIADRLLRSPLDAGEGGPVQPPPLLTPFHSRLAWVAVIDPPLMSSCPAMLAGSPLATSPAPSRDAVPTIVPYQALILDATTADDGLVYEARTNEPCQPDATFGPGAGALLVEMSVPWRLVSRDPGGLTGSIEVSVTLCDDYATGANTSRDISGLVEFVVGRPVAGCGIPTAKSQILRGPTVSDQLPPTLIHAATGDLDVIPDIAPASAS